MKKHNWTSYGRSGDIVEIILRDYSNSKIDSFKFNAEDKISRDKITRILKEKYAIDFSPMIEVEESVNNDVKKEVEEKKEDKDWLKSDWKW